MQNFKDFFQAKYYAEGFHVTLSEMSVPNDVVKRPIRLDADDVHFLQQFPPEHWEKALHQRYSSDLADALERREAKRSPHEKKVQELVKDALRTKNLSKLADVASPAIVKKLADGLYDHIDPDDKDSVEKVAELLADQDAEIKEPHVPDDEPKAYRLKSGAKHETIMAHPHANRLVHKLERNAGQEHHPESGLHELGTTHGEYGYDLRKFQRGTDDHPHTTQGMQLPQHQQVKTRFADFLNHNSHRMFGDFSDDPDVVWKPVGDRKDQWIARAEYDKRFKKHWAELATAEPLSIELDGERLPPPGGFATASERRKVADRLAKRDVIEMAERGELRGPPIPGVDEEGLPVKVKNGNLEPPPLYLPHKEKEITKVVDGKPVTVKHLVPVVKPAEYLREIDPGDEDVNPTHVRGHKKNYAYVRPEEYVKANSLAKAAFHVNHNTTGREYLDPVEPEHANQKAEIEKGMGLVGLGVGNRIAAAGGQNGQFFGDIIKGVWNAIDTAAGGTTAAEINVLKDQVPDLHQFVYQRMMMNLRDKKLLTPGGRRVFAATQTALWAQQDLGIGGGTRRTRRYKQDARSQSFDRSNAEGEGLQDVLSGQSKQGPASAFGGSGGGGRKLPTGRHEFSYSIDNLRKIIADLSAQAQQADEKKAQARHISRDEISQQANELLGSAMKDTVAVGIKLQNLLKDLFVYAGHPENEAEFEATKKWDAYSAGNKSSEQIVNAFKADPEVQQLLSPDYKPSGEAPPSMAEKDALERLSGVLNRVPKEKLADPAVRKMIQDYVKTQPQDVQPAMNRHLDNLFKPKTQAQDFKPAAHWTEYHPGAQSWHDVAYHEPFLSKASPQQLNHVSGQIQSQLESGQGDEDDHNLAILKLKDTLRKRHGL